MKKISRFIVNKAEKFVVDLLTNHLPSDIGYHTIEHAQFVVNAVSEIGTATKLTEHELNIARISGWFHDTGYTKSPTDHEETSAGIAKNFLKDMNVFPEEINLVANAIMATKVPQLPKNKIEEVLCDADMYHLSVNDYFERVEHMRIEFWLTRNIKMNKKEFDENSVTFFGLHDYHTQYGKTVLQEGKEKNLARIKGSLLTK